MARMFVSAALVMASCAPASQPKEVVREVIATPVHTVVPPSPYAAATPTLAVSPPAMTRGSITPRPSTTRAIAAPAGHSTPAPPATGATRTVSSTAYCEHGGMKSGRRTYDGAVAVPRHQFDELLGTRWTILTGPFAGKTVTVEDQIGHSSEFDIWVPSCGKQPGGARWYGRRSIQIARAA